MGCSALSLLNVERALAARLRYLDAAVVLNLHQVTPSPNPFWPGQHPGELQELLRFVQRTFDVVPLADLETARPLRDRRRPRLVLSFDDGYYDFLAYAVPLLDKYRVSATQNVITGSVQSGLPPWNVLMYDFLRAAPESLMRELRIEGFDRPYPTDLADRRAYGTSLSAFLKLRPRLERLRLIQPLEAAMAKLEFPRTRMMNVEEIRSIAGRHEIGCHSHSHESMEHQPDEFFAEDLAASQKFFAEHLQLPVATYAFPNGSYRPEQIRYLHDHGMKRVLLVGDHLVASGEGRVIPRINLHWRSPAEARLRTLGWRPLGLATHASPLAPS